jgi:hypothetical protein
MGAEAAVEAIYVGKSYAAPCDSTEMKADDVNTLPESVYPTFNDLFIHPEVSPKRTAIYLRRPTVTLRTRMSRWTFKPNKSPLLYSEAPVVKMAISSVLCTLPGTGIRQ